MPKKTDIFSDDDLLFHWDASSLTGRAPDVPPAAVPPDVPEPEAAVESAAAAEAVPEPEEAGLYRRRFHLRLAAVKWLLGQTPPPVGLALGVPTRISKFQADIAAFWNQPVRNPLDEGPTQILRPARTAILQICFTRDECWDGCVHSRELAPRLGELKRRIAALEIEIRAQEPELREDGALFEEYAVWKYEDSRNLDYHRLRRDIVKTEQALYKGTPFERIRQAALADQLWLAVPTGLIRKEELADGWGLLWVADDLSVTVEHPAEDRHCLEGNRMHLVQNIAAAASDAVLFGLGVQVRPDGACVLVQPPRGHRKPRTATLSG